jgi:hypothetical protein
VPKKKRVSFLDCPHKRVQDFTECCMDCGYNIYMTEAEYLAELRREARDDPTRKEIRRLEQSRR